MADAKELIALYDHEVAQAVNFRNLYQMAADLMFPRESNIVTLKTPGEERGANIIDPTGVMAFIEMASGLSINLFPPGQRFYNVIMSDRRLNDIESVKRTLGLITDISHEKRANSNFMLEANETLRALSVFGTGNTFSEWVPGIGLNYRDYDIGQYVITENSKGRIDGVKIRYPYTVRQASQEWGDNAGKTVVKLMEEPKNHNNILWFLRVVRPREDRNRNLSDFLNMPFESFDVSIQDAVIVNEGGFEEFPYAIPRWTKSSGEVWGRGQGTFALPAVRALQTERRDLIECGNKWNNPPLEVLETFEGEVRVTPGALNYVTAKGTVNAIDEGVRGNFPISKDIVEMDREEVKKLAFNDVFVQLRDLKGDRRNELEIRERLAEGLQRLGPPIGRLQEEWLSPLVTRDIKLLERNGELPLLPREMQDKSFKIEYVGRLALELKSQQSIGFQRWVAIGAEMDGVFAGTTDNINVDGGFRRLGENLGVATDDIASKDEVAEKRVERKRLLEIQQALQAVQIAGQTYGQTTGAPEQGSPAEAVMSL